MESVYAALLLHKAGQKIDEASLQKVLKAAGAKVEEAKTQALVAALSEVDIDEAIKSTPAFAAAPAQGAPVAAEKKEEEKKVEDEKKEDEAIQGLGSLFG
jgi:large subunit ribosomal protein L12